MEPGDNGDYRMSVPMCEGDKRFAVGYLDYDGDRNPGVDHRIDGFAPRSEVIVIDLSVEALNAGSLTDQIPPSEFTVPYQTAVTSLADAGYSYANATNFAVDIYPEQFASLGQGVWVFGVAEDESPIASTQSAAAAFVDGWCDNRDPTALTTG